MMPLRRDTTPAANRAPDRLAHADRAVERASRGDINRFVRWTALAILRPVCFLYLRLRRRGHHHMPARGQVILVANHRGVLDPIIVALLTRRRIYYMAKVELFRNRRHAWLLGAVGGFPVNRGGSDVRAIAVAEQILARGDCLVIFPEGRCHPAGGLARPRRGVGRLALASGAPVVPITIIGTESRSICAFPPARVRVRVGRPLSVTRLERRTDAENARLVTDRVWAAIASQWEAMAPTRSGDGSTQHDPRSAEGLHPTPLGRATTAAPETGS